MTLPNLTTITRSEALALILRGLQAKRADIETNLRDARAQLDGGALDRPLRLATDAELNEFDQLARKYPPAKPRRKISAAGRRRMAAAQRARWKKARAAK